MSKVTILSKPNRIVIASKGVQGPPGPEGIQGIQGPKGDTGDVTPEAIAARDDAVDAADAASQSADLAEQSRLLGATIGFATKADMDASLAHPAGTLALVTNDPDPANSVTYRKTGASGSGSWVQSADRVTGLEGRVAGVESDVEVIPDLQRKQDYHAAALGTLDMETSVTADSGLVVVPADAVHSYAPLSFSGRVSHAPDIAGGTLTPSEVLGVVSKDSGGNTIDTVALSPGAILRSSGAVADTMTAEGVITRRVLRVILDGDANWTVRSSATAVNTIALQGTIVANLARGADGGYSGLTDRIPFAQVHASSDIEGITVTADSGRFLLRINRSRLATQDVAGVKAWLSANPIEVFATAAVPTVEKSGHRMVLVKAGGTVSISSSVQPLAELRVVTGSTQIESLQHSASYTEAAIAASDLVSLVNGEGGSALIPGSAAATYSSVTLRGAVVNEPNISGGLLAASEVSGIESRDADGLVVDSVAFDPPVELRNSVYAADSLGPHGVTRRVLRIVLDGSMNWQVRSAPAQVDTIAVQTISTIPGLARAADAGFDGFSDRFQFHFDYAASDAEGMTVALDSARLYLRIRRDRLASQDASGVKAWLADNPVVVFATAAEPTLEGLPSRRIRISPGGTVSAISTVPPEVEATIIRTKPPYEMSENSLYFSVPTMPAGAPDTTAGMHGLYDAIESDHPEYVSSTVLGLDALGNELREYVFSEPTQPNDFAIAKPKIGLTSGIHGNEKGPAMGLLRVMRALADTDGGSTLLSKLRSMFDFYVIPVGCPSGWNTHQRLNHNGVNINRNFTTAWAPHENETPGPYAASEAETQHIEAWMASRLFDYYLDNHWSDQGGSVLTWNVVPVGSFKEMEMRRAFVTMSHLVSVIWPRRYASFPKGLPFGLSTTYPELAQAQTQAASYGGAAMLLEMAGPITYAESSSVGPVTLTCAAEVIGNVLVEIGKLEGIS